VNKPAGEACLKCPARDAPCVRPEPAAKTATLAVVGEAPGANEIEQGRPFVGASGRMLMAGLATIGLRRDQVHWTNAVLCECAESDLSAARTCCAQRLRDELAVAKPEVIMPVGAYGLQSVLSLPRKPRITEWRGSVSEGGPGGGLVAPTIHPAFVMRLGAWGPWLERDVERVGRLIEWGWRPPEDGPQPSWSAWQLLISSRPS
jgi:uracil-DNA glycosylase